VSFLGSVFPFPASELAKRYPSRNEYLGRFTAETMRLVEERYLVREDFHDLVSRGLQLWEWVTTRQ
jgi:hypothetical protein